MGDGTLGLLCYIQYTSMIIKRLLLLTNETCEFVVMTSCTWCLSCENVAARQSFTELTVSI